MIQKAIAIISAIVLSSIVFLTGIGSANAASTTSSTELSSLTPILLAQQRSVTILSGDDSLNSSTDRPTRTKKKKKQQYVISPSERIMNPQDFDKTTRDRSLKQRPKNGWIRDFKIPLNP